MKRVLIALVAGLVATPAFAQAPRRGQQLYENHCLSCHYERIHKRDPSRSRIQSFTALQLEVGRWAEQVKPRLAIADLEEITEYLNRSHYRFGK